MHGIMQFDKDRVIFALAAAVMFILIFCNICIIDDAYITFRTIDNFIHGYGLGWNADERVQAYTHPLWMLLHIIPYALFGNIYWVTIIISLIFGIGTVACLLRIAAPLSKIDQIIIVLLPLLASRIFINYVVCGLENPLSFFLFAWLMLELFTVKPLRYYRLCFIAALAITTRLDNILLLLPFGLATAFTYRRELNIGKLLLAFLPALLWYAFSLFYYGSFFPNTKYAKLNLGIETSQLVAQGLVYCANFFKTDPIACLITVSAFIYMISHSRAAWRARFRVTSAESILALLAFGFVLHTVFIIRAAGDFMPGRFFANMFIVAMAVSIWTLIPNMQRFRKRIFLGLLTVITINFLLFQPMLPDRRLEKLNGGIDDQHDWYYPSRGMLSDPDHFLRLEPSEPLIENARKARIEMESQQMYHLFVGAINGIDHYTAGPYLVIIDLLGIGDPLLSRLPLSDKFRWRVAHSPREMPEGYLAARQNGDTSGMQESLGQYYQKIYLITHGDLFSSERLKTIINLQLGRYDLFLAEYLATLPVDKHQLSAK